MKIVFIYFLFGFFNGVVAFSQIDTIGRVNYQKIGEPTIFINPFYNKSRGFYPLSATFPKKTGNRVSFYYNNTGSHSIYLPSAFDKKPLWKDLLTLAGQIALSACARRHDLFYISPQDTYIQFRN